MKMIKKHIFKWVSQVLALIMAIVFFITMEVSFCVNSIYASDSEPNIIELKLDSNVINDDSIKLWSEKGIYYISIEDLCRLTRCSLEIEGDRAIVKQGFWEASIDLKRKLFDDGYQSLSINILKKTDKEYLVPAIMFLNYFKATAFIDNNTLFCKMPSFTAWEALDIDFEHSLLDLYKIYGKRRVSIAIVSDLLDDLVIGELSNPTGYFNDAFVSVLRVDPHNYPSVKKQIISTQSDLFNEIHSEKWNDYIGSLKDFIKLSEGPAEWYIKYYYNASKKAFVELAYDAYAAGQNADVLHYGEKFYDEFVKENNAINKKKEYFTNLDYIMVFVSAAVQTAYETKYIESTNNIIYDVIGKDNLDYLGISSDNRPWEKAANRFQNTIGVSRTNIEAEATKFLTDKASWDILIGTNVSKATGVGLGTWAFGLAVSRVLLKSFPLTNELTQESKADLRSLLLSELQQNVYDVSQINLQKLQSDWDNRELLNKYLRSLELYCRTSIAMYENLQASMDRFDNDNRLRVKTQEQIDNLAISLYEIITMEDDNLDKCIPMKLSSFDMTRNGVTGSSLSKDEMKPYLEIVNKLFTNYGSLRIVHNKGDWQSEANGLCYLNLIDFTGDGEDELFAVCKNENEDHYTGYIYTLNNGKAELIYENPEIEYNTRYEYDIVYLGYTKDTGFIFGTGWDAPDIDDRTFYWYKDGDFEPVYRSKGYYDDGLEEKVIEEELKIVDIFDDEHIDELWDSFPRVTLRTMGEDDENGNYFGLSELQKSIDDVIRRLDVTPAELPPEVILPGMDVIADAEIYFCLENEIDQWEPSIENDEYFWSVIGNYGLSEPRIDDLNPIVTGDIGDAFILDKSIIENAAYACFSDFSGSLPQFRSYPDMWLVREVGEQTVTLGYGELGVMTERKNYEVNKDKSLDVIYTASYFQDEIEPIADYSVHMVENPNYDKENEFFTYYYTVTNIEKIKDYTETPATADEEAENDGVDPAITDISQVIDMNLTAAEAAHELGLNYEVEDDSEYYFYADSSCDESQGMLWCYGYQYDQNNNWKYHPGDSGISVYGLKNEMSEEELSSIVNKTHFIDVADYFGGDENDKFYYDTNQNEFVIAGKVQNGAVTDLTVFNAIDY